MQNFCCPTPTTHRCTRWTVFTHLIAQQNIGVHIFNFLQLDRIVISVCKVWLQTEAHFFFSSPQCIEAPVTSLSFVIPLPLMLLSIRGICQHETVCSHILFLPITSSLMGNYFRPNAEAMLLHQPPIDWLPIVLSLHKHFKVSFPCLDNGLQSPQKRLCGK